MASYCLAAGVGASLSQQPADAMQGAATAACGGALAKGEAGGSSEEIADAIPAAASAVCSGALAIGEAGSGSEDLAYKESVRNTFSSIFKDQGGRLTSTQMLSVVKSVAPGCSDQLMEALLADATFLDKSGVSSSAFVDWVFSPPLPRPIGSAAEEKHGALPCALGVCSGAAAPRSASPPASDEGSRMMEDIAKGRILLEDRWVQTNFMARLQVWLDAHPYLRPGASRHPHPLSYWVQKSQDDFKAGRFGEVYEHFRRLSAELEVNEKQIAEAFRRFDVDKSGHLDQEECRHLCAYLGWAMEELDFDLDKDGRVSLADFTMFVGFQGGMHELFEHRRQRVSTSRKDVCDYAGIAVGSRVRAHFYVHGQKSRSWREAQVLAVGVERKPFGVYGPTTYGVLLELGFGIATGRLWRAKQVVPPTWVLSSMEDASAAMALREIGMLDEQQSFWALLLPPSETQAMSLLTSCQRRALACNRAVATARHEEALPSVHARFRRLGYKGREVQAVLGWIQDLAPVVIHLHLDKMGHFMETDDFYRSQFETKSSGGAFDDNNSARRRWEADLFGGAYDNCEPFERCKYGALNVMNDFRGVVTAKGYGDSYLVLKDVRLRTTFASRDSGGLQKNRLGNLDCYAHVLQEYSDSELKKLIAVAMAATEPCHEPAAFPELLRGSSEDPTQDWVTIGFPSIAQSSGRFYFEVELQQHCAAPQVGLLSTGFVRMPRVRFSQGVGDDEHGWAVDGQNSAFWHGGVNHPSDFFWEAILTPGLKGIKGLKETVVVGVAVDLDERKIWFSSNGRWSDQPAFGECDIPEGAALYPAVSLRGKAAFVFGPNFAFAPPDHAGGVVFRQWACGICGSIRVDYPKIGDESHLTTYKEVQVHGEISLKRNVQRLVASSKYRDAAKTLRNYSLRIKEGSFEGVYERHGARDGYPMYRSANGTLIYADSAAQMWRLVSEATGLSSWRFSAPIGAGGMPPRSGWVMRDEDRGMLPADVVKAALHSLASAPVCDQGHPLVASPRPCFVCNACHAPDTGYRCMGGCDYDLCRACFASYGRLVDAAGRGFSTASLSDADIERFTAGLCKRTAEGKDVILRINGTSSFQELWQGLPNRPGVSAGAFWEYALACGQASLKKEYGLTDSFVVETPHPYDVNTSWKQEVCKEGNMKFVIQFYRKSETVSEKSTFRLYGGGLLRCMAGPGSRVEIAVPGGDKLWGTVEQRLDDSWHVRLDRTGAASVAAAALPAHSTASEGSWPLAGSVVLAKYRSGKWHKATVRACMPDGTYLIDWFDSLRKDRTKQKEDLRPVGARGAEAASEAHSRMLEDLDRYGPVPPPGVECFAVCSERPVTVQVAYPTADAEDQPRAGCADPRRCRSSVFLVGDEIGKFGVDLSHPLVPIRVDEFAGPGPAQEAGVREGWFLDLVATLGGQSHTKLAGLLTAAGIEPEEPHPSSVIDAALANATRTAAVFNGAILKSTDLTLHFTNSASPKAVTLLPEAIVQYGPTECVGDEVEDLVLDSKSRSLCISSFHRGRGPAYRAGVRADWNLDVAATLAANPALAERLADTATGIGDAAPDAHAAEDGEAEDDDADSHGDSSVVSFSPVYDSTVTLNPRTMLRAMAAQAASTDDSDWAERSWGCADWPVDLNPVRPGAAAAAAALCLVPPEVPAAGPIPKTCRTHEELRRVARELLRQPGVTLVCRPRYSEATKLCEAWGRGGDARWKTQEIPGEYLQCEFVSGCEGRDLPAQRWGILALVMPVAFGQREATADQVEAFLERWAELNAAAEGCDERLEVEREGWDEARLRALCAHHGWDFEWMSEDGERRRRARERFEELRIGRAAAAAAAAPIAQDAAEPDGITTL